MRSDRLLLITGLLLVGLRTSYSDLNAEQFAELQQRIRECGDDVERGTDRYLSTLGRDCGTVVEVAKWAIASEGIAKLGKYRHFIAVVELAAYLGDFDTAESYLRSFKETYKNEESAMGGLLGSRPVLDYAILDEWKLRAEIETNKRYYHVAGAQTYDRAIEDLEQYRRIVEGNIPSLKQEAYRRAALVFTSFAFYQHCGQLHELDGRDAEAMRMLSQAVKNYEGFSALGLPRRQKDGLDRQCESMRNEILLHDASVGKRDKYPVFHGLIDYYPHLGREGVDIAEIYLRKFLETYKGADFPVDGIIGPSNIQQYLEIDSIKFSAEIAEGRRYHRLGQDRDYSKALELWETYRQGIAARIPEMADGEQKTRARFNADVTHFEHCGTLYEDDGDSSKAQQMYTEAIQNYEKQFASLDLPGPLRDELQRRIDAIRARVQALRRRDTPNPQPRASAPSAACGCGCGDSATTKSLQAASAAGKSAAATAVTSATVAGTCCTTGCVTTAVAAKKPQ